jgi:hypothetical protein
MNIYNSHLVYFKVDPKTHSTDDVERKIVDFIHRCPCDSKYVYTPIVAKRGFIGRGQIWFDNPKIYRYALNLDENNHKRTVTKVDRKWKPPSKPLQQAIDELAEKELSASVVSWADYMEKEEELREQYKRPVENIEKEPLVERPSDIVLGATYAIEYSGYSSDSLCCRNAPEDISDRDIIDKFRRCSSAKGYPKISRAPNRPKLLFVNFREGSKDALFAAIIFRFANVKGHKLVFELAMDK